MKNHWFQTLHFAEDILQQKTNNFDILALPVWATLDSKTSKRALGTLFRYLIIEETWSHQKKIRLRSLNQSVTNIFEYLNIFYPNIDSDIHSYHFLDTNIFGYLFVSTFWIRIYSDIRSYQFSGHKQIPTMFLFNFSGYYTLLMDILLITMVKYAI